MNKHLIILLSAASAIGLIIAFFLIDPDKQRQLGNVTALKTRIFEDRGSTIPLTEEESLPSQNNQNRQPVINPDLPENLQTAQDLPSGLNVASLKAVGEIKGKAVVIRVLDDINSAIAIEATIADAPAGQNYYAWLTDGQTFHSLGQLVKTQDKYTLAAKPKIDLSQFPQVVISLDKSERNTPQTPALQGSF